MLDDRWNVVADGPRDALSLLDITSATNGEWVVPALKMLFSITFVSAGKQATAASKSTYFSRRPELDRFWPSAHQRDR